MPNIYEILGYVFIALVGIPTVCFVLFIIALWIGDKYFPEQRDYDDNNIV